MAIRKLTRLEDLDDVLTLSAERPVWLFKHSVTCGISARAHGEYQRYVEERGEDAELFTLLEVQNARPLSNEIAARFGIQHESPQAILVKDGKPVWNASHNKIVVASLAAAAPTSPVS